MSEVDGIEGIVRELELPLRPKEKHGRVSKVNFSAFPEEERLRDMRELTEKERAAWQHLEVTIEVHFGSKKLSLKEIAALEPGNLITLDQFADEPLDLVVNGKPIGRGEIVTVDGRFGVRLMHLEEKIKIYTQTT